MSGWDDVTPLLIAQAELDLRSVGAIRPRLGAFVGDRPLFIADVRPFPRGGYVSPLVELLALAGGFGADRLALAMGGRSWSLDDPIPPVIDEDHDLRQRVLVIERVDGNAGVATPSSTLLPYDLVGGDPVWHEAIDPGEAEGWLSGALRVAVEERERLTAPLDAIREQAVRCLELGHDIGFEVETAAALWLPDAAPAE